MAPMRDASPQPFNLQRYYYGAAVGDFVTADPNAIIGQLTRNSGHALLQTQTTAWLTQIDLLKQSLQGLPSTDTAQSWVYFEYNIPRMGRRIDAVLVTGPVVFAIEFKAGEVTFDRAAVDQVWDYALDLKNFHATSHAVAVVPILVATAATASGFVQFRADKDNVYHPVQVRPADLRETIDQALRTVGGAAVDPLTWAAGAYQPTPTIVEAARALYANHSVDAISRSDAGATNLRVTSRRIEELVEQARSDSRKIICFVTGVPGAGKTLVGLNVATQHRNEKELTHAVFLSGNGPLVAVLHEALTRDEYARQRAEGNKVRKGRIGESVKAFIQNVHHYRDEALIDPAPPVDHVAIFDEAQRAWNLRQTANFMQRKKNRPGFSQSEPEFLISYMDRHDDWAVIVCLVGGGQEINIGEAGIGAWVEAVVNQFPHWEMYISSSLTDSEYAAGHVLDSVRDRARTHFDECLHLSVSMRSFRAENVSAFVKAVLDCEVEMARGAFARLAEKYPMAVTRDLGAAKAWVRGQARGSERFGLVASSKAQRLKPHAIDIRVDVNPVHYFLNDKSDTRSSYYLEDAATEFQVQGLELDWVCVTWDGDLRHNGDGWSFHDFRGSKWCNINSEDNRRYTLNAYRVLLTRARQGMVIFVPPGDASDPTRSPAYYDRTFEFLVGTGIPAL